MYQEVDIEFDTKALLRPAQHDIFHDESRFKVCAMGRRYGKSVLASYILIHKALEKQESLYFFIAPTFSQARAILWEILKDKTRNICANVNESRLEITLINGSRILLKGADRPDTLRGVALSGAVFDEFASMRDNENVWKLVVRPALSDNLGWALFISSPAGRDFFYDLYNDAKTKDNWQSWQRTTLQGGNVPAEEIEAAKHDLDERSFRQEYLASFESFDGLVVPDYDRKLNGTNEEISDDDTLIFGIDFNVNKMPCVVYLKRNRELHLVDIFFGSFNTSELMTAIEIKYPKHKKIFHTDASGTANKSSAGGTTDIKIIEKYGYKVMNLRKNPNIIDRVNSFNSMVKSADGTRRFFTNVRLKRVVDTLEKHVFDENGLPNKKHEYFDDIFDAMSYAVWHYSDYGKVGIKTRQR